MVTTARQPKARLAKPGGKRTAGVREHSAQQTRESILRAAIKVFAQHGYEGGSVEKISRLAKSYDRMIYYYFGSKEGLFVEVLETIYQRMNDAEAELALDVGQPLLALEQMVHFVLDYYRAHPEFSEFSCQPKRALPRAARSRRVGEQDAHRQRRDRLRRGWRRVLRQPRHVFLFYRERSGC